MKTTDVTAKRADTMSVGPRWRRRGSSRFGVPLVHLYCLFFIFISFLVICFFVIFSPFSPIYLIISPSLELSFCLLALLGRRDAPILPLSPVGLLRRAAWVADGPMAIALAALLDCTPQNIIRNRTAAVQIIICRKCQRISASVRHFFCLLFYDASIWYSPR